MAKSIRVSCTIDKNHFFCQNWCLVVIIAVNIIINRGIAAILTNGPINIIVPYAISKQATNDA
jgi:hypothetical protein